MLQLLPEASIFAGRYRVCRCIASGGMGAVYEVEHLGTERHAALKVLLPHVLANETAREQFRIEARVAAKLKSENVVDVLDAGVDDATDMPYLVMELLEGEDLGARVHRFGRLPPEEVVRCLEQVARALDRVHARSIIHRDLKPDNLFLTEREDGSPLLKVLDFGIAKVLAGGASSMFTDQARGTPIYMSPEQFQHAVKISPATDIYSLGMVAFTLLAGDAYWSPELDQGMNVFVIARLAEAGPKEPASVRAKARGVDLPPAFDEWFARITAIDPARRFPRATEAIHALAVALDVALPVRPDRDRPSRPSFSSFDGRPSFDAFASPIPRPPVESSPSSVAPAAPVSVRQPPPSSERRHAQDAPTLPDGVAPPKPPAEDARQPTATASIQDEAAVETDRPAILGLPAAGRAPRDRAGKILLAAVLAAVVVLLVIVLVKDRSAPATPVSTPELPATASASVTAAPAVTATPAVTAAPAVTGPPSEVPSALAPVLSSSAHSSPTGSTVEPARSAPAHVAPSPASSAPAPRSTREVSAGSAAPAPAKKPKYTQD